KRAFARWLRFVLLIGGAVVVATLVWCAYFLYFAPLPENLTRQQPLTSVYLDAKGRIIAELAGPQARSHRPVPLTAMGPWLPAITIAMEDRRFYSHSGVDPRAIARALIRRRGGGSTI